MPASFLPEEQRHSGGHGTVACTLAYMPSFLIGSLNHLGNIRHRHLLKLFLCNVYPNQSTENPHSSVEVIIYHHHSDGVAYFARRILVGTPANNGRNDRRTVEIYLYPAIFTEVAFNLFQ